MKTFLHGFWLIASLCLATSRSAGHSASEIVFLGSTPGDDEIKSILAIPSSKKVDFIKWNLILNSGEAEKEKRFRLTLVYGEAENNTMGFKSGGEKLTCTGSWSLIKNENIIGEIYHLNSSQLPTEIKLLSINDNLLHLLSSKNGMMVGNGGWSYTLSRREPVNTHSALPAVQHSSTVEEDQSPQLVFDGRTPCQGFAKDHDLSVSADCFKLKWKLTLNRDSVTRIPTTYRLQTTFNRGADIEGKWTIIKESPTNPDAAIYHLLPNQQQKEFFLLALDDNLLFFLDKNKELYIGNADFSFTLNKRKVEIPDKSLLSLTEAEQVLGEAAKLSEQSEEQNDRRHVTRHVFTALETDPGTNDRGNLYFSSELYKKEGAAAALIDEYILSNQNHSGFELIKGLGDEAFIQTDNSNFITFVAVRSNRMIRLKVNKVTSKTSTTALRSIMKRLVDGS